MFKKGIYNLFFFSGTKAKIRAKLRKPSQNFSSHTPMIMKNKNKLFFIVGTMHI